MDDRSELGRPRFDQGALVDRDGVVTDRIGIGMFGRVDGSYGGGLVSPRRSR